MNFASSISTLFLIVGSLCWFELIPCPEWGQALLGIAFALSHYVALCRYSDEQDKVKALEKDGARMSKEIEELKAEIKELKQLTV